MMMDPNPKCKKMDSCSSLHLQRRRFSFFFHYNYVILICPKLYRVRTMFYF